MKYLPFLILALVLVGCDRCRYVDCFPGALDMKFRLVDDTGKDLVYDLNVSIDSLDLRSSTGGKEFIDRYSLPDKSLITFISPNELTYVLNYDGRSTEITLSIIKFEDSPCCGPRYETVEVNSSHGKAPIVNTSDGQKIHVITL